ncbi:MAG TPA: hypothetical protein VHX88_12765 [Solirubrobacteraceae bacterium]|jgi:hypothetical protein|nr:hypothetical protein [Solirubrobacteraceae bacterium]
MARGAVRLSASVAGSADPAVAFWVSAGYARQADQLRFVRVL